MTLIEQLKLKFTNAKDVCFKKDTVEATVFQDFIQLLAIRVLNTSAVTRMDTPK